MKNYTQGSDAYNCGEPASDNPYPAGTRGAIRWAYGWHFSKTAHLYRYAWRTGCIAAVLTRGACPYPANSKHAEYWHKGYGYGLRNVGTEQARRMHSRLPQYLQEDFQTWQ